MNLYSIAQIGTGTSQWSGESVRVNRNYVGSVQLRRLSRGRTALAVGVGAAAVGAFIATRVIKGSGDRQEPAEPPPPPGSSLVPVFRWTP
jgi:hypothetical protein